MKRRCYLTVFLLMMVAVVLCPLKAAYADTYNVNLKKGFNFVSFPITPADPVPSAVTAPINYYINNILEFSSSDVNSPWKRYHPGLDQFNDLTEMNEAKAYWIDVKYDRTLTINGTTPAGNYALDLKAGWNTMGWPYPVARDIKLAFPTLRFGTDVIQVSRFNLDTKAQENFTDNPETDDFTDFEAGYGYYIYMVSDQMVTITPQIPYPATPVLEAAIAGNQQAELQWTVSENAVNYDIKYGTTSGVYSQTISDVGNVTSHTVSGLTNGTTYYFVIVSKNTLGTSANSNELSSIPTAPNMPPTVNAGLDQTITFPESVILSATIMDDGLPNGTLDILWSKVSGPGDVIFSAPTQASTSAAFSAEGVYELKARVFDGDLSSEDLVVVSVQPFQGTITINSPFDGYTTSNDSIAVLGEIHGAGNIDVEIFINDIKAVKQNDKFLVAGIEFGREGSNLITAEIRYQGIVLTRDQIEVFYAGDEPAEILIDDFSDSALRENALGFWTSDGQTCPVNRDIEGVHNITWDSTADYWHTDLFDPQTLPKGIDAGSYTLLTFLVKGEPGTSDFTIELEDVPHGPDFNKTVRLRDFAVLTNEWQKVTIPLSFFTARGVWKSQLRGLVFHFDQQPEGTISFDDIKLSSSMIDDFTDKNSGFNRMGYATGDADTLVESVDINGYHKLTWNDTGDFWFSMLWDQQYGLNASYFIYLTFDIRGENGGEDFFVALENAGTDAEVQLSDYVTVTGDWKKVSIPLTDFIKKGADISSLHKFAAHFKASPSGTVYIDNIEFTNTHSGASSKSPSTGTVRILDKRLFVAGKPFVIKGVAYQPTPIGMDSSTNLLFQEPSIYNRDFPLLRNMGCNTIRTWKKINSIGFLDASYNGGNDPVYVIMGFPIPPSTDLSDPVIRNAIKDEFGTYVSTYKDHPAVLLWALGNEENIFYQGDVSDWYSLTDELAELAYLIEGENYHPVAVVNADLENIGDPFKNASDDDMSFVDIWGINLYRGYSNRSFFKSYSHSSSKPIWISEYGADSWMTDNPAIPSSGHENQLLQGSYYVNSWHEIISAPGVLGGTLMEFSDEWWKSEGESWDNQDHLGIRDRYDQPDKYSNEEFWGLFSIERDLAGGADRLTPKASFEMMKKEYHFETANWWNFKWEFNSDGDKEGVSDYSGSTEKMDVRDGLLVIEGYESGESFWSQGELSIDPEDFPVLQMRANFDHCIQAAILFQRRIDGGSTDYVSVPLETIGDGNFHTYSVDLSENPDWTGEILRFGIGIVDLANAKIEIDYIRLSEPGARIDVLNVNNGDYVNTASLDIEGTVDDPDAQIKVNSVVVSNQSGSFSSNVFLNEGENIITVEAINERGIVSQKRITVICDTTAPDIQIISPSDGHISIVPNINVSGTASDASPLTVFINGTQTELDNGSFSIGSMPLGQGTNTIVARAEDAAGNSAVHEINVIYSETVPWISITSPQTNHVTDQNQIQISGEFQGNYLEITVNGAQVSITPGLFSCTIPLENEGANSIEARMIMSDGGPFISTITVIRDTKIPLIWITTPFDGEKIRGY